MTLVDEAREEITSCVGEARRSSGGVSHMASRWPVHATRAGIAIGAADYHPCELSVRRFWEDEGGDGGLPGVPWQIGGVALTLSCDKS